MCNDTFKNPAEIYRGTDFWMLNDRLMEDEIRFQIHEMKAQGVYSFIARTYIGLKSDYPGKDFMGKMHVIVDTARECGMRVFIQAGYMPEAVVGLPAEYALRYICPVRKGEENGRRILCSHDGYLFAEHNSRTFLDMFDPDAMNFYLVKSYEEMWSEFSDEYGKTILSVWVDEPSYKGSNLPWTPKLEKAFREKWGYALTDKVWMLYFDGDGCETVRYHYRTLMRDLLEENYFKRVRDWCDRHKLLFSGHLMAEETLTSQIFRAGATMPYYKYFDIPGIDVLSGAMNWIDDPIHPSDETALKYTLYNTAMQCVSAARQAGKKHILAEMYGVTSENMTFRNQLNMFDAYASMGINHRSVHGMFYSLHGRGKRAYPPHINYYQPFWKKYKNVTDYCARVSAFISEGRTEADIAVIHPLETGFMLYRGTVGEQSYGGKELKAYDKQLYDILKLLKTIHRDPELCDLATLRDMGEIRGNRLKVGEMSYGTVILPKLSVITSNGLRLLEDFTAGGGKLIIYGHAPAMLDGIYDEKLAEHISGLNGSVTVDSLSALEALISAQEPQYTLVGRGAHNLLVNRRVCADGFNFFLFNTDCAHEAVCTLETAGCYEVSCCDAFTGETSVYPSVSGETTKLHCTVPNGGSLLFSFRKTDLPFNTVAPARFESVMSLDDAFEVVPGGRNAYLLEYCQFRTDEGYSKSLPILAVQKLLSNSAYHGEVTLRYEFRSQTPLDGLTLAAEDPECQHFTLDGKEIPVNVDGYFCDKSFKTFALGNIAVGTHTLEVRRLFRPLSKATSSINSLFETQLGVELEPMYLLGGFTVRGIPECSANGCMVYDRDFTLSQADKSIYTHGELTADGFPFYTGELTLYREFYVETAGTEASVRIGTMNAGAGSVSLNRKYLGDLNRAPACLNCTGVLKPGRNMLEIKLYTTLRNLIGPFHRPRGEVGNLFGGGYTNPDAAWLSLDVAAPGWEKHMADFYPQWTDSYNLTPLGVSGVEIVVR